MFVGYRGKSRARAVSHSSLGESIVGFRTLLLQKELQCLKPKGSGPSRWEQMQKERGTYRHPELMPLLCRCSDLNFSPRSRHDDTLGEQTRRLDVSVLDNLDVRDEHCYLCQLHVHYLTW